MNTILPNNIQQQLKQVRLLALDVDGVLTDGGLYYTETGEELKKFNVKDGMGIKLLMQAGIEIAIITNSSSPTVIQRAKKLGIVHVFLSIEDKLDTLIQLCQTLNLELKEVAYVGDDINDLAVLKEVGLPLTVADAMPQNKAVAAYVTERLGGNGAVREVCEMILQQKI